MPRIIGDSNNFSRKINRKKVLAAFLLGQISVNSIVYAGIIQIASTVEYYLLYEGGVSYLRSYSIPTVHMPYTVGNEAISNSGDYFAIVSDGTGFLKIVDSPIITNTIYSAIGAGIPALANGFTIANGYDITTDGGWFTSYPGALIQNNSISHATIGMTSAAGGVIKIQNRNNIVNKASGGIAISFAGSKANLDFMQEGGNVQATTAIIGSRYGSTKDTINIYGGTINGNINLGSVGTNMNISGGNVNGSILGAQTAGYPTAGNTTITIGGGSSVITSSNPYAISIAATDGSYPISINNSGSIINNNAGVRLAINNGAGYQRLTLNNSGVITGDVACGFSGDQLNLNGGGSVNGNIYTTPGSFNTHLNIFGGTIAGNINGSGDTGFAVEIKSGAVFNIYPYHINVPILKINSNGTATINNTDTIQQVISLDGTLTVNTGATISNGIQSLSGTLNMSGGVVGSAITGGSSSNLSGAINVKNSGGGNVFTVSIPINHINSFVIDSGATTNLNLGGSINKITSLLGTLNVNGGSVGGPITGGSSGSPSGTINVKSGSSGANIFTVSNPINYINSFVIEGGATTTLNVGGSINKITSLLGILNVNGGGVSGAITGGSSSSPSGTINVKSGSSGANVFTIFNPINYINSFVIDSGATATLNAGGSVNQITSLAGTLNVNGGSVGGNITGGSSTGNAGTITVKPNVTSFVVDHAINYINNFAIEDGATVNLNTGGSINQITDLAGTLNVNSGTVGGNITGRGANSIVKVLTGNFAVSGAMSNVNSIQISSGAAIIPNDVGSITINAGGSLVGPGTIGTELSPNLGQITLSGTGIIGSDTLGVDLYNSGKVTLGGGNAYIGNFYNNATGTFNANSGKIVLGTNSANTVNNIGEFNVSVGNINAPQGVYLNSDMTNSTSTGNISIERGGDISSNNGVRMITNSSPGKIILKTGGSLNKNRTSTKILKIFGNLDIQGGVSYAEVMLSAFDGLTVSSDSVLYGNVYGNASSTVTINGDFNTHSDFVNIGDIQVTRTLPKTTTVNVLNSISGVAQQFRTNTGTTVNLGVGGDISGATIPPHTATSISVFNSYISTYGTTIVIPQPSPISLVIPTTTQVVGNANTSKLEFNATNNNKIQFIDSSSDTLFGGENIQFTVSHGTISVSSLAGLSDVTISPSITNKSNTCTITNSTNSTAITNLNTVLNNLVYTPNVNYVGPDTLSIIATDLHNTQVGTTSNNVTVNASVPINVISSNSNNVILGDIYLTTYQEGSQPVVINPNINVNSLQLNTLYPINANTNYNGIIVTLNRANGVNNNDIFSFNTTTLTNAGMRLISQTGTANDVVKITDINDNNNIFATINNSNNQFNSTTKKITGQLEIKFGNGSVMSLDKTDAILQAIQYSNNANIIPPTSTGSTNNQSQYVNMVYAVKYDGIISSDPATNKYEMAINNAGTINMIGGTIGASIPMGIISNSGIFNLKSGSSTTTTTTNSTVGIQTTTTSTSNISGGFVKVKKFINCSLLAGPTLNITSGNMYVENLIDNLSGIISVSGGDLSSMTNGSSILNNVIGQKIIVTSPGTIGGEYRLGKVINEGIINAAGNIAMGTFTNAVQAAQLNISSGNITVFSSGNTSSSTFGDIDNKAGIITISGGDLSTDPSSPAYSSLINEINGIITVSGGSIGANQKRLGDLTNSNQIVFDNTNSTASTSGNQSKNNINIGTVNNQLTGSIIINGYNVATANNSVSSNATITNAGTLTISKGDLSGTVNGAILSNTGNLTVGVNASIGANASLAITQSGVMTTSGIINANITFGTNSAQLIVNGGLINGVITGFNASSQNIINISVPNNTFKVTNSITNVSKINVNDGDFTFSPLDNFSNINGGVVKLGDNSGISLTIKGGTVSDNITGGSRGNVFNISGGVIDGNITAGAGNNVFNISGGVINKVIDTSAGNVIFNISGNSVVIDNSITANSSNQNVLNVGGTTGAANFISKAISNIQTINVNATSEPNNFTIGNAISGVSNSFVTKTGTTTVITTGGSLYGIGTVGTRNIPSAGNILISGTPSTTVLNMGNVYNMGSITASGGNVIVGDVINNAKDALINITTGTTTTGNITNTLGKINIIVGDLSSSTLTKTITNAVDQTIAISGNGTIGATSKFSEINNSGNINLSEGTINVGALINNASGSLQISGGIINASSSNKAVDNFGKIVISKGQLTVTGSNGYVNNSGQLTINASTNTPTIDNITNTTAGVIDIDGTSTVTNPFNLNLTTSGNAGIINIKSGNVGLISLINNTTTVGNNTVIGNVNVKVGTALLNGNANNRGAIVVDSILTGTNQNATLTNTGTLTINQMGIVNLPLTISNQDGGTVTSAGTVNVPINFPTNSSGALTITGGKILGAITGGVGSSINTSSGTINIQPLSEGTFTTSNVIKNVATINLNSGNLVVNKLISGVSNGFITSSGTIATINSGGDLSGIANAVSSNATTPSLSLTTTYATTVNINSLLQLAIPTTYLSTQNTATLPLRNIITITDASTTVIGDNVKLNVSNGTLSYPVSYIPPSELTISGKGTHDFSITGSTTNAISDIQNVLNNLIYIPNSGTYGIDHLNITANNPNPSNNQLTINSSIPIKVFPAGIEVPINLPTSYPLYTEGSATAIKINPRIQASDLQLDLVNQGAATTNYNGITITVVRTEGANVNDIFSLPTTNILYNNNPISVVATPTISSTTYQLSNSSGKIATATNANGQFQINFAPTGNGNATITDQNLISSILQAIHYKNETSISPNSLNYLDLSYLVSVTPPVNSNNSIINNGTIIVDGGCIGHLIPMGTFNNLGIFNVATNATTATTISGNSNLVTIGNFINRSSQVSPTFNVNSGQVMLGNITNVSGGIEISGGDLSSSGNIASNLVNVEGQKITVSGSGTIGAVVPLGQVNNEGTFIAKGGDISVASFSNSIGGSNLQISSGNLITKGEINNFGTINISGGSLYSKTDTKLINHGTLILNSDGTIGTNGVKLTIDQYGTMTTAGIIKGDVNLATEIAQLTINGGSITGNITGFGTVNQNVVTINVPDGTFTAKGNMINVNTINLIAGDFVIQSDMTSNISFQNTVDGVAAITLDGGNITGTINGGTGGNTYNLEKGTISGAINTSTGANTFNINKDSNIQGGANSALSIAPTGPANQTFIISGGLVANSSKTAATIAITSNDDYTGKNNFNISGGGISNNNGGEAINVASSVVGSSNVLTSITITSTPNITGDIVLPHNTPNTLAIGSQSVAANFVTNGKIVNAQTIVVNNTTGNNNFTINNPIVGVANSFTTLPTTITTISDNGSIVGGGIINNAGILTVANSGKIGNNSSMGHTINTGTINANGGNIELGILVNGDPTTKLAGSININQGVIHVKEANNLGSITISGNSTVNGDLSSFFNSSYANLTNAANKTIAVTGTGTIGATIPINAINNSGIVSIANTNLKVAAVSINSFTNQLAGAELNIISGNLAVTNTVVNDYGRITISGGDLSTSDSSQQLSNLVNSDYQTLTISDTGTIGANKALGTIANTGILNANGGNITCNVINNGYSNANIVNGVLNINGGTITAGTINNNLTGIINISGGTLAKSDSLNNYGIINANSDSVAVDWVLTNKSSGVINVNKGVLSVANTPEGVVNNSGKIQVAATGILTGSDANTNLNNLGSLIIEQGGVIDLPLIITQSGKMQTAGTIKTPINFAATNGTNTLVITGGTITAPITGSTLHDTDISIVKINLASGNGSFVITNPITNVKTIEVQTGNLVINSLVNGVKNQFFTASGTLTTIGTGGDLSGGVGNVVANVSSSLTNDLLATYATTINVSAPLSIMIPNLGQTIYNNTSLLFNASNNNVISIIDTTNNIGNESITLTVTNGKLSINNSNGYQPPNDTSITYTNNDTSLAITGTSAVTLNNLNSVLSHLQYTPNSNYVGSDNLKITVINANRNLNIQAAVPIELVSPDAIINLGNVQPNSANYTAGALPVKINPNITATTLQLDTLIPDLTNYNGMNIILARTQGTNVNDQFILPTLPNSILYGSPSRAVSVTSNDGTNFTLIDSSGNNIATAKSFNGELQINFASTAGNGNALITPALFNSIIQAVQYKYNANNPPASIDVSYFVSVSAPQNTNAKINNMGSLVIQDGSIGFKNPIGEISNSGTFTVGSLTSTKDDVTTNTTKLSNSNVVNVGDFINCSTELTPTLHIMSGQMTAKKISNISGGVTVAGGDLSSSIAGASSLINVVGQTVTISGTGTIGKLARFGSVTNEGSIIANGGDVAITTFTNSLAEASLTINSGNVNTQGNINNALGNIIINKGSLYSVSSATLNNAGSLTINTGGVLGPPVGTTGATLTVQQSGTMITSGTINANIEFATSSSSLTVKGGQLNGSITGYPGNNSNTIKVSIPGGTFTVSNNINNVNAVNIIDGNFAFTPAVSSETITSKIILGDTPGVSVTINNGIINSTIQGGSGGNIYNITGGTIGGGIEGGNGSDTYNISGGNISSAIIAGKGSNTFNVTNNLTLTSGSISVPNSNPGSVNTLNIGDLSNKVAANFVGSNISKVTTINVQQTSGNNNFTIVGNIVGVDNYFTTLPGTTTNIGEGGNLSGGGTIGISASNPSKGTISLSANGTINMSNIYNGGTINVRASSGDGIIVGSLYNLSSGLLNITSGKLSGTSGTIINNGKIIILDNQDNITVAPLITNNVGGEIDVTGRIATPLTLGLTADGNKGVINIKGGLVAVNSLINDAGNAVVSPVIPAGQINVNGGTFTLTGTSATNNGAIIINNGAVLTGVLTGTPAIPIKLINAGSLTVNAGAFINTPLTIHLHGLGTLQSAGTINSDIKFDSDFDHVLTIAGGVINGTIAGNNVTTSTINIDLPATIIEGGTSGSTSVNSSYTTANNITNIQVIKVTAGNFTVANAITEINNNFTTNTGAVAVINSGGSLSGTGTVGISTSKPNMGTITLLGSGTMDMTGTIYNAGSINVQTTSGNGMLINNLNNSGQLTINSGDLSGSTGINNASITNNNQITVLGSGTIGNSNPIATLTNKGTINAGSDEKPININSLINQATGTLNINGSNITVSGSNNAVNNTGKIQITKGQLIATNGFIDNSGNITINANQNSVTILPITNSIGGEINVSGGANIPLTLGLNTGGNSGAINVNSGLVIINSLINNAGVTPGQVNVNGGILTLSGNNATNNGIMTVNKEAVLTGALTSTPGVPIQLVNTGNLIVNAGATIDTALTIIQSGTIQSAGTINAAINFGDDAAHTLTVTGGTINGHVQGSGSQSSVININIPVNNTTGTETTASNAAFTTNSLITNVGVINVNSGNFIVNNNVSGVSGSFKTLAKTVTTIKVGGNLSGGGEISNFGTIQLSGGVVGGTIGKTVAMGDVYNVGDFIAGGGNVVVGAFTNGDNTLAVNLPGHLTVSSGIVKTGDITNTYGTVTISGGDLSSVTAVPVNSAITNVGGQVITVSGAGTVGVTTPFGAVNNSGIINANGGVVNIGVLTNNPGGQVNIDGSKVGVANIQSATGYSVINNVNGQINIISGDLSGDKVGANLSNSGTINLGQIASSSTGGGSANLSTGSGALGEANSLSEIYNSGTINANGNIYISSGVNNTTTGNITVYSSGNISGNGAVIQNFGKLYVASNGVVEVSSIVQAGKMTTAGIINTPIDFDLASVNNNALTIAGGAINRAVTGNGDYSSVIIDMPNNSTFSTNSTITNVGTLQVGTASGQINNLIINNPIIGINNAFITYAGTTTTIAAGGDISGVASVNSSGASGSGLVNYNNNLATYAVTLNIVQPLTNIVPKAQIVDENTGQNNSLEFSSANGNAISILNKTQVGGVVQVVLTATHGTISLPNISSEQTTITITDNIDNINNILNTLKYKPDLNYTGLGQLAITTSDNNMPNNHISVTSYVPINILNSVDSINFTIPIVEQYIEGSKPILISSQVTLGDLQLNNQSSYNNTTVTIFRSTGANINDVFSFPRGNFGVDNIVSSGTLTNGAYSSNGTLVLASGAVIANFVNSGGALELTFTANATADLINEVIKNIQYSNYSNNPSHTINLTYAIDYAAPANSNMAINNAGTITVAKAVTTTTDVNLSLGGTIGATAPMGQVTNSGTINANGGNVTIGDLINCSTIARTTNSQSKATGTTVRPTLAFNVTSGDIKVGNIKNIAGGIAVSGGDVSNALTIPNSVINFIGQVITLSESGTLGENAPLGNVINEGAINLGGGNVTIGEFTNTLSGASLTISSGNVKTDNFLNYLGEVKVSGGDLSGISNDLTLTNASLQTITASGGSVGAYGKFNITNSGIFNVAGANVNSGTFINDGLNATVGAVLNISAGSLKTNVFSNNYGQVTITGGDLSPTVNNIGLTNSSEQIITISGGTLGNSGVFDVINSGKFNVAGGVVTVDAFTNDITGNSNLPVLNITLGAIKTGIFTNKLGNILISGGDLSAASKGISFINAADQAVVVSGGSFGVKEAFNIANSGVVNVSSGVATVDRFVNDNFSSLLNVSGGAVNGNALLNSMGEVLVSGGVLTVNDVTNVNIFDVSGGKVVATNFANNSSNASLNISSGGVVINTLQNTFGNIIIAGGDLSGTESVTTAATSSVLTNGYNQVVTISSGTIGDSGIFSLNNSGVINAKGGSIKINQFINDNLSAELIVDSSNIAANSIKNTLGYILITSGDLSSLNASNPCSVINYVNQVIDLKGVGTIGVHNAMGPITNEGIINAAGGNVNFGTFTNNSINAALNIKSGNIEIGDLNNTLGIISLKGGDLSSVSASTPSTIVNAVGQEIIISDFATIGQNNPLGPINNNGLIIFGGANATVGDFVNDNEATFNITSGNVAIGNIQNILGTIKISGGDLSSANPGIPSSITNANGQEITISGTGTIGFNNAVGPITNSGIIIANGGAVVAESLVNNDLNAAINITTGNVTISSIQNTLGTITIAGGDLSSNNPINPCSLVNEVNQIITVTAPGTIGANYAIGAVTNSGIINAASNQVVFGDFLNNNASANLNITAGQITVNSVTNTLGTITISGGDLSSVSNYRGYLINGVGQVITVSGGGTVGDHNALGDVINNGVINVQSTGGVKVGSFTNDQGGTLNVVGSKVYAGDILNQLGTIQITNGGDLSSESSINASSLINAVGQNITVDSGGTLGLNQSLSDIINSGVITVNASVSKAFNLLGVFTNSINGHLTINNSSNNGVKLPNNFSNNGVVNINNTTGNPLDVSISNFTNHVGGTLNINGTFNTGFSNLTNDLGGIVNIGADLDLGSNIRNFINNGTLIMQSTVNLANGNYILGSTGVHITSVDPSGSRQLNLLNGSINLTPGATIGVQAPDNTLILDGMMYPVANCINGGIIVNGGDLNSINVLGDTGLITYKLSISDSRLAVIANRSLVQTIVNQAGDFVALPVAAQIDTLFKGTVSIDRDLTTALLQIEKLPRSDVNQAVIQLSPELNIVDPKVTNFEAVFNAIGNRTDLIARSGITEVNTGYIAGGIQSRGSFWIKGLAGSINQTQRDSFPGYLATSVGFATGADVQIIDDAWCGLAFSSVGTKLKSKDWGSKTTNINSYQAILYTSYSPEDYYVDGYAALAVNRYKTSRNIIFGGLNRTATAIFNGIQPTFKIVGGYYIHEVEQLKIIPNASLQYSMLHHNKYKEDGAGGIGLEQVSNDGYGQLEGGIGLKLAILHSEDESIYNPDIHAMILRDFRNNNLETTAKFIGGGSSFKINGALLDKTTYNLGAGVTIIHKDQLHFTANYELRKKNKFIGHSGSLAVRYEI